MTDVTAPRVLVRPREAPDIRAAVRVLRAVHERDRYPLHWPAEPERFLRPPDVLGAWVAADGPDLIGHAMLTQASPSQLDELSAAQPGDARPGGVAMLSRLFVSPAARGLGAGVRLLAAAVDEARRRRLPMALEVLSLNTEAIALYQRAGWTAVGTVTRDWAPEGTHVLLLRAPAESDSS